MFADLRKDVPLNTSPRYVVLVAGKKVNRLHKDQAPLFQNSRTVMTDGDGLTNVLRMERKSRS